MAQFPNLEHEAEVQENDKTRLNASKSFVSRGSTALSTITVKPQQSESAISVYDSSTSDNWYLDWEYSLSGSIPEFDIVVSTNHRLEFDVGGTLYSATLSAAQPDANTLASSIQTALNSAYNNGFVVTFDDEVSKFEITGTAQFKILPVKCNYREQSLWPLIGWPIDKDYATTHTSEQVDGGYRVVTLTVGDGSTTTAENKKIKVLPKKLDFLYSTDSSLTRHEPDILKWVPAGRNSFLDIHRRAQRLILEFLDRKGYVNIYNERYRKQDLIEIDEVSVWSCYLALRLIFEGLSNSKEDVFAEKAKKYKALEEESRDRALLRIDTDRDQDVDILGEEGVEISSAWVFRR